MWARRGRIFRAAIQVNVRAGQLPPPDNNGIAYLRIPLNALPTHG